MPSSSTYSITNSNVLGLGISLTAFIVAICVWFFFKDIALVSYLNTFGWLLIMMVFGNLIFFKDYNFFSPFLISSLMLCTYSLNMFYISAYGISSAQWLALLPISDDKIAFFVKKASFTIILYYFFFSLGVFFFKSRKQTNILAQAKIWERESKNIFLYVGLALTFVGSLFFIYYSYAAANGPIDLLANIGRVKHLERHSRAPVLLCYIGVYIYVFYVVICEKKSRFRMTMLYMLVIFSFLIYLTSGRISQSVKHVLFIIVFLVLSQSENLKLSLKKSFYIVVIMALSIGIYFGRLYSSIYHAGINQDDFFEEFDGIYSILMYFIVGKGNLLDMQQFVTMELYMQNHDLFYGKTIIQSFFIWFLQTFNIEFKTPSLLMRDEYFPDFPGAPVSGAIVEVIMNFGYFLGLPIFMLIGYILYWTYDRSLRSTSLIVKAVYAAFFCRFLLGGYFKVDASALNAFILHIIPLFIVYFCIWCIHQIYFRHRERK